ncbi:MAG: 4Fe-4S dicluster domain-containing protein [Thermoplasmata archaeon]|uniref:4Fe-4S dicluster domain-containing protein n=1 Tax=Candidatus Sysuiplasma superficiale TaxID=2823368 RepID=A0A8J7YLU5_9ARCH|nr:4Fe-4S dicluster domain-containing protein [Candidatus Sysuiplasma superficiale]
MPIHEKNLIEEDRILEKEKAELEGRDVSGQWNTFIEQRILSQYEPEIFQEIYSRPEGRTINRCWQCGTCTSGCCMHTDFGLREFNPRYFIYLARIGDEEELKKQKDVIWRCLACNKCVERCPKDVRVEEVVHAIDSYMRKKGWAPDNPASRWDDEYLRNVMKSGILDEISLLRNYIRDEKIEEFDTHYMMKMAVKLLKTGRMRTGPVRHRTKGWKRIRKVAEEILEKDGYELTKG